MRALSCFCLFLFACCVVCNVGCGGAGGGSKTGFMVGGKVTYPDGKPVNNGTVTLVGRVTARGDIIGGGSYSISTRVPAGTYKVTVTPLVSSSPLDTPSPIDAKYGNPETSELACEVKGPTEFNITVEAPK
jgi:hypothetical protein